MADTKIFEKTVYNYEQQEAYDEYNTLTQEYFRAWVTLEVNGEFNPIQNRTDFKIYVYLNTFSNNSSYKVKANSNVLMSLKLSGDAKYNLYNESNGYSYDYEFEPNQVNRMRLAMFYDTAKIVSNNYTEMINIPHYFTSGKAAKSLFIADDFSFRIKGIKGFTTDIDSDGYKRFYNTFEETEIKFPTISRGIDFITANNFTDEENPVFSYSYSILNINDGSGRGCGFAEYSYNQLDRERVDKIEVAISFDGINPDISYRDIPLDTSSYTITLTEEEREAIRIKAQGSNILPIYYLARVTRTAYSSNSTVINPITSIFYNTIQRNLTVVGSKPVLNPTVKDIKPETLALTGNENIFVKYESMVEFATGAVASKHATIVSQSVQCGSKTVYNLYNGVIDDVESADFIFNATDSRGLNADMVVIHNAAMIDYIKPTCLQELSITMSGETTVKVTIKNSGSYYFGSFGAVNNELKLEARYKSGNDEYGDWITLTGNPTYKDGKYELISVFDNLPYKEAYTFQCRATDKLNTVITSAYILKLHPVFDWSETDFNFNVPVNINAEEITMHGNTIIRHNEAANNTVISAPGGKIYLRPGGTDETDGETVLHSNGSVDFNGTTNFNGTANFNYSFTIGGYILNDYVIETGEQSMGSNGTWYWRKWASGKSEAWGCRNFGRMAVTTAWGNLYRSEIFTQDLPSDVFIRTPDSININIVHANYGGWICKHEQTAPSADTTGSFIFVRPASATVTPTNIGFYVIGEWY